MYRHYKGLHMETCKVGAPALIARALVSSLTGGPLGTPLPVDRLSIKDENVDLGWYRRTVCAIRQEGDVGSGIIGARESSRDTRVPATAAPVAPMPERSPPEIEVGVRTPTQCETPRFTDVAHTEPTKASPSPPVQVHRDKKPDKPVRAKKRQDKKITIPDILRSRVNLSPDV